MKGEELISPSPFLFFIQPIFWIILMRSLQNIDLIIKTNHPEPVIKIPIKIYSAAEEEKSEFNELTPEGNRYHQRCFDQKSEKEYDRKEMTLGFEYSLGKYASISKQELESIIGPKRIELRQVGIVKLSPEQICKSYYLQPNKSEKVFHLFRQALKGLKYSLVCIWFNKRRDDLVVIRPTSDHFIMHCLYFNDEVRQPLYPNNNALPKFKRKELAAARGLLTTLAGESPSELDLGAYSNGFTARLRVLVDSKIPNDFAEVLTAAQ